MIFRFIKAFYNNNTFKNIINKVNVKKKKYIL